MTLILVIVFVHNVRNKTLAWLQGIIVSQAGPLPYKIKLDNACIISHHVDHIRYRSSLNSDCDDSFDTIAPPQDNSSTASNPAGPSRSVESSPHQESPTIPRRSSRVRRPPDRYSPSQGRSVVTWTMKLVYMYVCVCDCTNRPWLSATLQY